MNYVTSCGAVVFTVSDSIPHYVIIRSTGGEYGFPKGHMEPGESEQQTALREIGEEVGLRPRILDGFRQEVRYPFPNKPDLTKISVYYLAEFSGQELTPQPEEISSVQLLPYGEAYPLLTFEETKAVLAKAHQFLSL